MSKKTKNNKNNHVYKSDTGFDLKSNLEKLRSGKSSYPIETELYNDLLRSQEELKLGSSAVIEEDKTMETTATSPKQSIENTNGFVYIKDCISDQNKEFDQKLKDKLESYCSKGNISTLIYSNPNNPSWICFTEQELQIIGELANKYDVVVMEDLAYFAMDFRKDMSKPGIPPYQSSVANYTKNYILLISSSKSFSYAGQRVGMLVISNELFDRKFPDLKRFFKTDGFGYSMIYGAVYSLSSGTSHSAQYGLAAMLKAANDGDFNFVEGVREYGERAKIMKKLFADNGFKIVYDMDEDQPLADGFYFTFSYPGFDGVDLLEKLLYYGISAISLITTGSERIEGLRACVSQIQRAQLPILEERLRIFNQHHKQS